MLKLNIAILDEFLLKWTPCFPKTYVLWWCSNLSYKNQWCNFLRQCSVDRLLSFSVSSGEKEEAIQKAKRIITLMLLGALRRWRFCKTWIDLTTEWFQVDMSNWHVDEPIALDHVFWKKNAKLKYLTLLQGRFVGLAFWMSWRCEWQSQAYIFEMCFEELGIPPQKKTNKKT